MEFGIFDHLDQSGLASSAHFEMRLQLARDCEQAGFYAYHVAEHHGTPLGAAPSPALFLSALAQRTTTLRFGPLVYILPLYHPVRLYEEICMLDQMSGGRLELGVGRGISPYELGFFEIDVQQAQARFTETLALLRQAFASEVLDFSGQFHSCHNMPLAMKPLQQPHPPLWYGVLKPETAEWAARNGMNIVCGHGPSAEIRAAIDRYRSVWREQPLHGATQPKLGMTRQLVVAATDAEAQHIAARAFRVFRHNFAYLWERNNDPLAGMLLPEDFASVQAYGLALAGSPQTVTRVLRQQITEAGSNYLLCRFAFGDISSAELQQSLRLFARHVMPDLRDADCEQAA